MTTARQDLITLGTSGWFHLVNRCVRRAFLCGADLVRGRNYDHRHGWIRDRLLEFSSLFAIDQYAFSVISNHYHAVVYVDVERLHGWDDEEIAGRWLRLCPPRGAREDGVVQEDSAAFQGAIATLSADAERLATCRDRLGDISWFMRFMNEGIVRRATRTVCGSGPMPSAGTGCKDCALRI